MRFAALVRFSSLVAWRRTLSDWRLQAAAAFGVVLAATLMAAGVLYTHALEQTALHYTLRTATQEDVNLVVRAFHPLERPAFFATQRFVQGRVERPLSPYVKDTFLLIQTSTLYFSGLDDSVPEAEQPRGALQSIDAFSAHTRLVEGRYPGPAEDEVEFVADAAGKRLLGLSLDQTFKGYSAIAGDKGQAVSMKLVGVIEPVDPSDQYWSIGTRDRVTAGDRGYVTMPMYVDRETLFSNVGVTMTALSTDFVWLFVVDRSGLPASDADRLSSTLAGVLADVQTNLPDSTWTTKLGDLLDHYQALLVVARVPLLLVLFLAVGVLLYYLFLIAGFLGRLRTQEVGLLRSRGASFWQAGVVMFIEGLIMAAPATIFGPFLAKGLVAATGKLFPAISGGAGLETVGLSQGAFLLAGAGAFLAAVVFTLTTLSAARKGLLATRTLSARPPEQPFFLRYYLDAVLLALLFMVWWQLRSQGTFLVRQVGGTGLSVDAALLLGPVVGVLAAGMVILRVFPLLMKLVARLLEPFAPTVVVHAMRRLGRDPVPTASLLVLVVLATSLGVLSSTVIATLQRSQREQAQYQSGADFRVTHHLGERVAAGAGVAPILQRADGVVAASDVLHLETKVFTETLGDDVAFLGIDPTTFPQVAWNRPDLTNGPLGQAITPLQERSAAVEGIVLPPDATAVGVWAYAGRLTRRPSLFARMQDGQGWYFDMLIGTLSNDGWTYLEAQIKPMAATANRGALPAALRPPYTLHTLWAGAAAGVYTSGILFLDQLQATTPSGHVELASFQELSGWHPLEDPLANGLYSLESSEAVTRPGRTSAMFIWGRGGLSLRGIRYGSPEEPFPTLVSKTFLVNSDAKVGDTLYVYIMGIQVPVKIVGTLPYFPTLDPNAIPFMVGNINQVLSYVALHAPEPLYPAMDTWVDSQGNDAAMGALLAAVKGAGDPLVTAQSASDIIAEHVSHPLLTAGWSGLLALSFLSVVLASASGLLLYTYIDAREQVGQLAILRTLGFSRVQVNGLLWFNLGVTVLAGTALGLWGGRLLAQAILPLMAIAEGGAKVVPPMVVESNWNALVFAYLVLTVVMALTIVLLARAIARLEVQRLLRVAEA